MQTSSWGKPGWVYLHTTSFNYPNDPDEYDRSMEVPIGTTRQAYKQFFTSVGETLPCRYCRDSYKQFVIENPIRLDSRDEITRWLYEIHNKVNEKLNKPSISFDEVKQKYDSFRADCSAKVSKGCVKPLNKMIPMKCYVVHTRCPSFTLYFFISAILMIMFRIIYKKGKLHKLIF